MGKRMMDEINLFDSFDPPMKSTDWKWEFKDYPKEKNGIKVFSCFACGGVVPWDTSSPDAKCWGM